jgi:alpha-galactosidase
MGLMNLWGINMVERLKLTYIGAGSHRFSMGLFKNIIHAKELHPMDVTLLDIDPNIVKWTTGILRNMAQKAKVDVKVTGTTNQREALEQAEFIYKSISVGGQKAEWYDNYVPVKFGVYQNTGDTCGPGGFFRALRCCYVVHELAKNMKELCPNAVLLNYTNPQAQIVKAARNVKPDLQYIGLCHELFGGMGAVKLLMDQLGYHVNSWENFDIRYGGVNHFAWLTGLSLNGEDLYPKLLENAEMAYKKSLGGRTFNWYLTTLYHCFPYPGSRHVGEFMPEYYNYFNHTKAFGITSIRNVFNLAQSHKWAIQKFKVMGQDFFKEFAPNPTGHGEKAMEMTSDWKNNTPSHHVVNIPNKGYIPNLPDDAIVEIPGYFKDGKMFGVKMGALPQKVADRVRIFCEIDNIAAEAAVKGDRNLIVKALTKFDPMTMFIEDDEKIEQMIDLMLYYQQQWLPSFKEQGSIPSWDELKTRKYVVEPTDLKPFETAIEVKYPPKPELVKNAIIVEGYEKVKDEDSLD